MPVYIFMLFHATYSMPYTCISIFHAVSCYPDSCKSMHNILHAISWQCSYSFMLPSIMPNHASVYSCFFMPYFHAIFMPYLFMHNALDGRTTAGLYEAVLYNNFFVLLCVLPGRYWNVSTILRVPGPRSGWVGSSLVAHITHTRFRQYGQRRTGVYKVAPGLLAGTLPPKIARKLARGVPQLSLPFSKQDRKKRLRYSSGGARVEHTCTGAGGANRVS